MTQQLFRNHKQTPRRRSNQVRMVANIIRKNRIFSSDIELGKKLPSSISYLSLKMILINLEGSNKITRNRDGSIVWIYADSPQSRKSLEESVILR